MVYTILAVTAKSPMLRIADLDDTLSIIALQLFSAVILKVEVMIHNSGVIISSEIQLLLFCNGLFVSPLYYYYFGIK